MGGMGGRWLAWETIAAALSRMAIEEAPILVTSDQGNFSCSRNSACFPSFTAGSRKSVDATAAQLMSPSYASEHRNSV
jgi:hypothetical protein